MKKLLTTLAGLAIVPALLFLPSLADADHFEFPSTNEINEDNSWAHVTQDSIDIGETTLTFVSERNFFSCFEYRTDGDESQAIDDTNYNPNAHDLYPFYCLNNETRTESFEAEEYVEVRMVFGAESDERFDWTRFDVLPQPFDASAEITSPDEGEVVSGNVEFTAEYIDQDGDDAVQWAVRSGTCAAGTGTVAGNVDGHNNPYNWDNASFETTIDMSAMPDGDYCFVFNPTEDAGDENLRETVNFVLDNSEPTQDDPTDKEECKNGGWADFGFSNQGQCIRFVQTGQDSR